MKRKEVEYKIREAYDEVVYRLSGGGRTGRLPGYAQAVQHRSKFDCCGRLLMSPYGREVAHWCRRPVCPTCATHWGRKLGRGLIAACSDVEADDYRMVTLIVGLAATPDDAFDQFRALRRGLGNALDYRRRAAGIDRAGWRAFGMAGALELDQFLAEDFSRLGDGKRQQYRTLGFDVAQAHGPQWVVTVHGLVHVGALGDAAVTTLFEGLAPVVHLQALDARQGLVENAEGVVGYASKIRLETALAFGETRPWPPEAVVDYLTATMRCSRGRQGFKLSIRPARPRKDKRKSVQPPKAEYLEPMPVLF